MGSLAWTLQAAEVRGVGELFGSRVQLSRIERLETEVTTLREVVARMSRKRASEIVPRGFDDSVVAEMNKCGVNVIRTVTYSPESSVRVSRR